MSYRIYIVEDHEVMRSGYMLVIDMEPDLEVCGASATATEALAQIPEAEPDLVVVDVSLPGMSGIELVEQLRETAPHIKTLVISGHDEDLYAQRAIEAGARGYVDKFTVADVMPDAIRAVLAGELYLTDRLRARLELD